MARFNPNAVLAEMEKLRRPSGAFIAAPSTDYYATWLRDMMWCAYVYWYLGEYEKCRQGIWLIFDIFKQDRKRLVLRTTSPTDILEATIHAKRHPDTLERITGDDGWGHHQLDVYGLFLHVVADLDFKNLRIIREGEDLSIIQDLVSYLRSVEYWQKPDFGMWEECKIRHCSSIGAVVDGLSYIQRRRLAIIADPLIQVGYNAMHEIFPFESRDICGRPHHNHDCDAAQLFLIWPFRVVVRPEDQDELLERVINGHVAENGDKHKLLQPQGFNRYWGDDYYRSTEGKFIGVSAMWPMFFFLVSIIYSQRHESEKARHWFEEGCNLIVDGCKVPEAYKNGVPNDHTPLAWGNALALIAYTKMPAEIQAELSSDKQV